MKNIYEIKELAKEIEENFIILEQHTAEILSCDIDEIEAHTIARVELLEKNKGLYNDIFLFCEQLSDGRQLADAVKNTADRAELCDEYKEIFDLFNPIYGIVQRVVDIDKQVTDRIQREQDKIVKQIKDMNNSADAKAAKYATAGNAGTQKHFLNSGRKA